MSERAGQLGRRGEGDRGRGRRRLLAAGHPPGRPGRRGRRRAAAAQRGGGEAARRSRSGRSCSRPRVAVRPDRRYVALPHRLQRARRRHAAGNRVPRRSCPALPEPNVDPDQFAPDRCRSAGRRRRAGRSTSPRTHVPAISPDGTEVAILTPDEKIAVFDSNGKVLWQDKVPKDAESPVYTTIDSQAGARGRDAGHPVLLGGRRRRGQRDRAAGRGQGAVLRHVAAGPDGRRAGASVVSGGELKTVPNQPRRSTILLAEGDKALMARYPGPLYWSQPGKDRRLLNLKPPGRGPRHRPGGRRRARTASWRCGPAPRTRGHSRSRRCTRPRRHGRRDLPDRSQRRRRELGLGPGPDPQGRRLGRVPDQPQHQEDVHGYTRFPAAVDHGTTIYGHGQQRAGRRARRAGKHVHRCPTGTARPWGVAGQRAIIVHDSVALRIGPGEVSRRMRRGGRRSSAGGGDPGCCRRRSLVAADDPRSARLAGRSEAGAGGDQADPVPGALAGGRQARRHRSRRPAAGRLAGAVQVG